MNGVDFLNGDPADYDRGTVDYMVHELQERLRYATKGVATDEAFFNFRRALGLRPSAARVLMKLSNGKTQTKDALASVSSLKGISHLDVGTSVGPKIVDVHICVIRKSLKPRGLLIETIWGVGYRCPPETCDAIREIMLGGDDAAKRVARKEPEIPLYAVRHIHAGNAA